MQEMGMNVKHPATVTRPQTLRYLVLNSSKSKARLKFMKLGMLSWSSINRGKFFVPFEAGLGYASHKPELLTTSRMVSVGNVPPLGTKQYPLPLIPFKKNSRLNIEQQECCVIFQGSFGHFYALTEFSMHSCA